MKVDLRSSNTADSTVLATRGPASPYKAHERGGAGRGEVENRFPSLPFGLSSRNLFVGSPL